jgi:hypothetical protein
LLKVYHDRFGGGDHRDGGRTLEALQVWTETVASVFRDFVTGGQRLPRSLDGDEGIRKADKHIGDRIQVGRGIFGGCAKTLKSVGDQRHARLHDRSGRRRLHGRLLAGVAVQFAQSEGMVLHGPDGVGEGG